MHRTFTFLIGLSLLIWGQHHLLTKYDDLPDGLIPIAIGLIAIGAALWGVALPAEESPPMASDATTEAGSSRWRWGRIGLLLVSVALAGVLLVSP